MADGRTVVAIDTEEAAWSTLEKVISGEIDANGIELDFSEANWAKFEVVLEGVDFKQTITPAVMKGLVDLQLSLYRSAALILRGEASARRLTDIERSELELIFKVENGSSEIWTLLENVLKEISGKVIDKLDTKTITILVLGLALTYGGHSAISLYCNNLHQERVAEIQTKAEVDRGRASNEAENERLKINIQKDMKTIEAITRLAENNADTSRKHKILTDASAAVDGINIILDEGFGAYEGIVRQSLRADSVIIQGKEFNKEAIQVVRRTSRRNAEEVTIVENVKVVAIDRLDTYHFQYRLEVVGDDRIIVASISDQVLIEKYGRMLRERLGDGKAVRLDIKARQVGDELLNAEITKARADRRKPKP